MCQNYIYVQKEQDISNDIYKNMYIFNLEFNIHKKFYKIVDLD